MEERPLWAPWRLEYVTGPKGDAGCIFCDAAADGGGEMVVHVGERTLVLMNAYPYAPGHTMVAPRRHVPSVTDLDDAESLEFMALTQRTLRAAREAFSPDGFNLGINEGKVAGAGFADHLHLHVVPRWGGDVNFMPVVAGTKVMSQALDSAREALRAAF